MDNDRTFLIYGGMGGARVLVQLPLERWRYSGHFSV